MRVASHDRRGLELIRQLEQLRDKLIQKHMAAPLIAGPAPPKARPAPLKNAATEEQAFEGSGPRFVRRSERTARPKAARPRISAGEGSEQ
jgi:hypothetical protein